MAIFIVAGLSCLRRFWILQTLDPSGLRPCILRVRCLLCLAVTRKTLWNPAEMNIEPIKSPSAIMN